MSHEQARVPHDFEWRARLHDIPVHLKRAIDRWSEIEGYRLGASFSFYATFAIFPLLLLSVTVIGFVLGDADAPRERLLSAISDPGSPVRHVLDETILAMQQSRGGRGASAVIGIASLLFSASGAFVELDAALNRIYRVPPTKTVGVLGTIRGYVRERLSGFAIVGAIGLTLLASLVMSALLGALSHLGPSGVAPLWRVMELAVSMFLLTLVFVAAFHFVPRSRPPVRDVIGGAVLTTLLLTGLKAVFAAYLAHLTSYSAYGIVGGVLALATWIYLSSQIMFFGATLTCVVAESTSDSPASK